VIKRLVHKWELALSMRDSDRRPLPFEWGVQHLGDGHSGADPHAYLRSFSTEATARSDAFYAIPDSVRYRVLGSSLVFESPIQTAYPENNSAHFRLFAARSSDRAVIVVPQWNADETSHVALCRLLRRFRISALLMSLPYHNDRRPKHLKRAEYMVSPNIGRTIEACRQAVQEVRLAVSWLVSEGYKEIGVFGTSIGSCISFLALAHDERIGVGVFNHVSNYFADVVWTGISTRHVKQSLEGNVDLDDLRHFWAIISPQTFIHKLRGTSRDVLLISASHDLTFIPELSRALFDECDKQGIRYDKLILPCGHYSMGRFPFKYILGAVTVRYFKSSFRDKPQR